MKKDWRDAKPEVPKKGKWEDDWLPDEETGEHTVHCYTRERDTPGDREIMYEEAYEYVRKLMLNENATGSLTPDKAYRIWLEEEFNRIFDSTGRRIPTPDRKGETR
jgi:hypothetical protein